MSSEKINTQNYDARALFALPPIGKGSAPEKGLLSWDRPYLIEAVRDQGVDVEVVRGYGALDAEGAKADRIVRPEYSRDQADVAIHDIGSRALEEFGVVRSIIKAVEIDDVVPVLNPTKVRKQAKDKYNFARDYLIPAGAYHREHALLDGSTVDDQLDTLPSGLVVAKPLGGLRSRGVVVGTKQEVAEQLRDVESLYVAEEKLDFSAPLPGIRGYDEDQQARLDQANRDGVNKEVRLYYFGNDEWDSVARVARPGETDFSDDKWLYIDHDSIPNELMSKSRAIIESVAKNISTDEMNVAIDWVYASSESQPEPSWQVMEVNAAEPQLIKRSEHHEIGARQYHKMATQISRIALS